jgi:hypothetical protein
MILTPTSFFELRHKLTQNPHYPCNSFEEHNIFNKFNDFCDEFGISEKGQKRLLDIMYDIY